MQRPFLKPVLFLVLVAKVEFKDVAAARALDLAQGENALIHGNGVAAGGAGDLVHLAVAQIENVLYLLVLILGGVVPVLSFVMEARARHWFAADLPARLDRAERLAAAGGAA